MKTILVSVSINTYLSHKNPHIRNVFYYVIENIEKYFPRLYATFKWTLTSQYLLF